MEEVRKPSRWVWVGAGQESANRPVGFQVLPRSWMGERTFAWLGRHRRVSKDDEVLPKTEETCIFFAMSRLMTARLAR